MKFDFDYYANLYKQDPEQWAIETRKLIDDVIDSAPPGQQKRLRGQQFKIDHELSKYTNQTSRMNKMVEMFWDQVHDFNNVLQNPDSVRPPTHRSNVVKVKF